MATIRLQPDGHEVPCEEDQTILQALEQAGRPLDSDCRAGTCGTCKARMLDGDVSMGAYLPMALPDDEAEQGFILTCIATPESDVVEIDHGEATGDREVPVELFPPREDVLHIVVDKFRRTDTIVELRVRPLGERLRYWPGQYVVITSDDGSVEPRPYSIANAPRPDGEIILIVARAEGGSTSQWVHDDLEVGDEVRLSGAYGTFVGDPAIEGPVLCLAGGSGLAPILALTDAALSRGFDDPVTLLFSARTEDDVYERGLISLWEQQHDNFRFIRTLTRPEEPEAAEPPVGRIPDVLPELFEDLSDHHVFIAGSPEFVEACAEAALDLGTDEERLHVERYVRSSEQPAVPR